MRLTHTDRAIVSREKLRDYLLAEPSAGAVKGCCFSVAWVHARELAYDGGRHFP